MGTGSELLEHQEPAGLDVPDGGGHDKGEDAGGDQENVQHQERLHSGGGRGSEEGESVGVRVECAVIRRIVVAGGLQSTIWA